VCSGQAEQEDV
jgi:DNA-binding NarL/FixJ family response regulator